VGLFVGYFSHVRILVPPRGIVKGTGVCVRLRTARGRHNGGAITCSVDAAIG
jgi:hypothetical protein